MKRAEISQLEIATPLRARNDTFRSLSLRGVAEAISLEQTSWGISVKRSVLFLIILLLTSCSASPDKQIPELGLDIPTQWSAGNNQPGSIKDTWWTTFNDEGLNAVIEAVLKHNHSLKGAAANVEAVAAEARIAGADIYPQFTAGLSGSRRKQNYIGLPIPGMSNKVLTTRTDSFGSSLDLSWEVDLWGRIRSGQSAALANLEAARADLAGAQLSLIAQASKVWFTAVEIQGQLQLARATLDNHKKTIKWTQERYEQGLCSSTDLRMTLSKLALVETVVNQWQEQSDRIVRQLEILMGKYPAGELSISDDLCSVRIQVPAGLPADLISGRPDLVAAERKLAATIKLVDQAKANLYPRLSLTAGDGASSSRFKDLMDGDFSVWSIAGNLLQPIFQGGKIRAGIKQARAQRDRAIASFADEALNAYAEVEVALLAEQHLARREKEATVVTEQAHAIYEITRERYQAGLVDLLTLLQTERSALESKSQFMIVRRQRLEARINLYLALGGGFNRKSITEKSLSSNPGDIEKED